MSFQARDDALRLRRALVDVRKLCAALGLSNGAKPQARGLLVLCPWHVEKHASCSVTLGQDGTVRVHCFTCQGSGDALTLIARVRELDIKTQFRDVLAEAARIAGSEPPGRYEPVPEPGHATLDLASYSAVAGRLLELCSLEKEDDAVRYLEQRKLFVVACHARVAALPAPGKQGALIRALLRDFEPATLELAGLVRKGHSFVHPFHRLIIPWRRLDASVDLLQRRRLDDAEPKKKYVLPPERRPLYPFGAEQLGAHTAEYEMTFVEGALDVLALRILARRDGLSILPLGIPGVGNWRKAWATLAKGRTVRIGFDADAAGERNVVSVARDLRDAGATRAAALDPDRRERLGRVPRKRGSMSDGSGYSTLVDVPETEASGPKDERPVIVLRCELMPMTDEAISALARVEGIYQREGFLVDIVPSAEPDGLSRISQIPPPRLREVLSSVAICKKRVKGENDSESLVRVAPTKDLISMIIDRRHWPTLRPLNGIARAPIVRLDGTVCTEPGYDAATGLFYEARCEVTVSKSPTNDEAMKALARLRGLLADFPFAAPREVSEAVCLAALLTIVGRSAVDGPVPLTLIDASEKGSGKTLLADVLGAISQGGRLPRQTQPESREEWKKTMVTIALEAPPMVLFDNVSSKFGSDALDAFLTGTRYQDRLLSKNETVSPKTRTVFVVTANNPSFKQDTIRRSLHVRITPKEERPEQRAAFKHPNLLRHIDENRGQYLGDALTLLRAYVAAGRPPVQMRPMGSYEEWSAVVRAPLIWLGLPDPAETQDELRESADDDRAAFGELLAAWVAFYGEDQEQGVTVLKLLEDLADTGEKHPKRDALRAALCAFCDTSGKLPAAHPIGCRFRTINDRSAFGLRFKRGERTRTGTTWRVVRA